MNNHRWIYTEEIMNVFWDLGFEDISYSNDLCDSIGLDLNKEEKWLDYFQIFLANSSKIDADLEECEEFNTSILYYYQNGDLHSIKPILETNDITELLSMFKTFIINKGTNND